MLKAFCKKHPLAFLLSYLAVYLIVFELLECFVHPRYIVHCALDDYIPFSQYAIVPYCLWYAWIPLSLWYAYRHSEKDFFRLVQAMIGGTCFCLLIYVLFPTGLDLRRTIVTRDVFSRLVIFLRRIDTPTNVCPSLHVYNSMVIWFTGLFGESLQGRPGLRQLNGWVCVAISVSTVLLRQHSLVDVACGVVLAALVCFLQQRQILLQRKRKALSDEFTR